MLLGALVGAGWPETALQQVVADLGVPVRVTVARAERRGVPALRVEVVEDDPEHERLYPQLAAILDGCGIAPPVRERAAGVLHRLAEVESQVHGVPVDRVHLHELGGLDTLVDVVGVLAGVEALALDRIVASPVNVGRGWVRIKHGVVPVPAPATQALLDGMPVYAGEVEGEWLTPTGAALLQTLVHSWGPLPPMRMERIGTGAGRDDPERANVLRLFVGEAQAGVSPFGDASHTERLVMLETSIDDMNPQLYPVVTARLIEAGALDVAAVPAVMKKGRPGHVLRVLVPPDRVRELTRILLAETTTLGVRVAPMRRLELEREERTVMVAGSPVRIKVGRLGERIVNVAPEHDDCVVVARETGRSVKSIWVGALAAAEQL